MVCVSLLVLCFQALYVLSVVVRVFVDLGVRIVWIYVCCVGVCVCVVVCACVGVCVVVGVGVRGCGRAWVWAWVLVWACVGVDVGVGLCVGVGGECSWLSLSSVSWRQWCW